MWLINTTTLRIREFTGDEIPLYAILSHTWGDQEVTFRDIASLYHDATSKQGWQKICETCRLAREHGLSYAWIDTVSIDKSSSSELSEAVNSMFAWYSNADVCFAWLEDLQPGSTDLSSCRWFTRGWTLQELIAPHKTLFFNRDWEAIGSKEDLTPSIGEATNIPLEVISGTASFLEYSVAARMSWAAKRKTRRTEDAAYCLLGLFDVHMPLIYGEGLYAFRRLQEEIIKRDNDLTIFAWDPEEEFGPQVFLPMLAPTPACFSEGANITVSGFDFLQFSITNKGLLFSAGLLLDLNQRVQDGDVYWTWTIRLGYDYHDNDECSVRVSLSQIGPGIFARDGRFRLARDQESDTVQSDVVVERLETTSDFFVLSGLEDSKIWDLYRRYRSRVVHLPEEQPLDDFLWLDMEPQSLWERNDRVFLKPSLRFWSQHPIPLAARFVTGINGAVQMVVICSYTETRKLKLTLLVEDDKTAEGINWLFDSLNTAPESTSMGELQDRMPEFASMDNSTEIIHGRWKTTVSASLSLECVRFMSDIFCVKLESQRTAHQSLSDNYGEAF
ncbi:Vegetative incompatibility protein HET-E-1 [Cyphellophora attinorum]|uniref:Vegetative incompatibility protein HET-E-1 n=1 Tax=Cyphellophora attinorum TaxID=1664694 RepID=A0A0N0NRX7_9EURO|nr:Vegetative incompatibility protein HET-E-1 [Phialophora attinorum]KPI45601.1 Vegetative incompatibility protein HET-E-1 [Phialophora attinorum]